MADAGTPRRSPTQPVPWWPAALARATVDQCLSSPVPADDDWARRKPLLKRALRTAKRQLELRLGGQAARLHERIEPGWQRLLWIHEGMPQIGDALMDLAPRSLLAEHGLRVDLFAAPHIAELFAGDPWFVRVRSDPIDIDPADYDAAIVLYHERKALQLKTARLPALPWVGLHGFYGGPDFLRGGFVARRLADLLGVSLDAAAYARHAAQKLAIAPEAAAWAAATLPDGPPWLALAVGGVHAERTYHRWDEVLAAWAVRTHGRPWSLLLVGGDNGTEAARALAARWQGRVAAVHDAVGREPLARTQALLARAAVVACADGGLMHVALTTPAPLVALFTAAIAPAWRLPPGARVQALQSGDATVDAIGPDAVAAALATALVR